MSDRRPENPDTGFDEPGLWMIDEWIDEGVVGAMQRPTLADLISVVRRGVESGTNEGEVWIAPFVVDFGEEDRLINLGTYLVIPVSDGGEDQP